MVCGWQQLVLLTRKLPGNAGVCALQRSQLACGLHFGTATTIAAASTTAIAVLAAAAPTATATAAAAIAAAAAAGRQVWQMRQLQQQRGVDCRCQHHRHALPCVWQIKQNTVVLLQPTAVKDAPATLLDISGVNIWHQCQPYCLIS